MPSVVVRRWNGRADPTSAAALADGTGARFVAFGQLSPSGRDSVRLAVELFDAKVGSVVHEIELRDQSDRPDRLGDSLSLALLRGLAGGRASGVPRFHSLGTNSLPAMKQYLQSEQYYRQGRWDSAAAAAQRAVQLDSTFALSWRRLGWALGWRDWEQGVFQQHFIRAGAHNRGLAPRDSLIVAIDASLANGGIPLKPMAALADEAIRRYPDDPEVWYLVGEFRSHRGFALGLDAESALEAFNRSIALDTAFAPAYLHPVGLWAAMGDLSKAYSIAQRLLALEPESRLHRILALLLSQRVDSLAELTQLIDSAPAGVLATAYGIMTPWPDTLVVPLARAYALRTRQTRPAQPQWPWLALALASRGRIREAMESMPALPASYVLTLGVLSEKAEKVESQRALDSREVTTAHLAWWGDHQDTVALRSAAQIADSMGSSGDPYMRFVAAAARAHILLAMGDTARGLAALVNLPDSTCPWEECVETQRATSKLLAASGRDEEAFAALNEAVIHGDLWSPAAILALLERAELAERTGRIDLAREWFEYCQSAWRNADPVLRPFWERARDGSERLRSVGR